MKISIHAAGCAVVIVSGLATPVAAQVTQLGSAVAAAENSTALQIQTGDAVQMTCGALVGLGQSVTASQADLRNRCGEMVGTGRDLIGDSRGPLPSFNWTNNELAAAMQQLSGEESASNGRLAVDTSNGQFENIGMRLDAIRTGSRATAGGLNLALQGAPIVGGNAGEENGTGWGWFANGALGFGEYDGTDREDEYDYDSVGATVGVDYLFDSGLVLGLAATISEFEIDFEQTTDSSDLSLTRTVDGGKTDLEGWSLTPYAVYTFERFYIDAVFTIGENDIDTERDVAYESNNPGVGSVRRTMRGKTDSKTLAWGTSIGTDFELAGATTLYVNVGMNYLDVEVDAYEEIDSEANGGLNLGYLNQDIESLQSFVGAEMTYAISTNNGVFLPFIRAEWRHEFENDSETLQTYYAAYGRAEAFADELILEVQTEEADEDYFELGLGVSAVFGNNLNAFISYSTTVGLDDVEAHLFTVGIRGSF